MTTQLISPPYHLGALLTFKATSEQTAGRMWAKEHAFCVESPTARMLVVSTPGGFEKFFFETGEPAAALAEHGVAVVGPPPAPTAV